MADETQPQLFDNPPQPETPEASRQRRKHELLLTALRSSDRAQRRALADEYAKMLLEELRPKAGYHL